MVWSLPQVPWTAQCQPLGLVYPHAVELTVTHLAALRALVVEAEQAENNFYLSDPKLDYETFQEILEANTRFRLTELAAAESAAFLLRPDACTACVRGSGLHRRGCVSTYGVPDRPGFRGEE